MTIRDAVLILALIGAAGVPTKIAAQTAEPPQQRSSLTASRSMSVRADPSTLQMLTSLTAALDPRAIHIAPVAGGNAVQSIAELLTVKGADAAVVPSDVLSYLRRDARSPKADLSIGYVAKLGQEEVHILARREIGSLADLAGKSVNFGASDSRAFITGSVLFQALRINVQPVSLDEPRALDKLRRGEIAAIVHVAKTPARLFFDVNRDDGVHFVPVPFTPEVARSYVPGRLDPSDYPLLIGGGEAGRGAPVATIAVPIVLAVNNRALGSSQYSELARLIDAPASHPPAPAPGAAVATAYAADEVPGWHRFTAADLRPTKAASTTPRHEGQASRRKDTDAPAASRNDEVSQNQELAQQFIRYWQQHTLAEKQQPDASQEGSGTSTQRRSGTSTAAATREWEALMEEFLRWRQENHPEQSAQTSGEVFEEVLHTLYKP